MSKTMDTMEEVFIMNARSKVDDPDDWEAIARHIAKCLVGESLMCETRRIIIEGILSGQDNKIAQSIGLHREMMAQQNETSEKINH